jgi:hypothetical protein
MRAPLANRPNYPRLKGSLSRSNEFVFAESGGGGTPHDLHIELMFTAAEKPAVAIK